MKIPRLWQVRVVVNVMLHLVMTIKQPLLNIHESEIFMVIMNLTIY